jgi:hypothetical protein
VNELPKQRQSLISGGRAIAEHLAVYSPKLGNLGYFPASGGYFAEILGRKRRGMRSSQAAASAIFRFSRT